MPFYKVLISTYLPDTRDRPVLRSVGEVVPLSEAQASYLILTGQIEASGPAAPPPPYLATDTITVRRGGVTFSLTDAELAAFFAPLGGSTLPADTLAPTITTSANQTVSENAAFSLTLAASEAVTWTKTGGSDAGLFTLSGATLSMSAKDYEAPTDANGDNAYVVQVMATDAAGNAASKTITVTVTNVVEATLPPPAPILTSLIALGAI